MEASAETLPLGRCSFAWVAGFRVILRRVKSQQLLEGQPARIGPYRLEELLGSGGMGAVWRAWDDRLRRSVAIKQVRTDAGMPNLRERLRREARAAAGLNHPAIVHVYDIFEDDEGDWIVMELAEGRTLRRQLDEEGPLHPLTAARLGREVAEGLAEAHAHGILHRDLKTSNVIVTRAGHAKILDFGVAKLLPQEGQAHEATLSVAGTILGTCYAMSPEQVLGRPLDGRSDLFSLGCLLYEALTDVVPFQGETNAQSLALVLNFQPRALHRSHPGVPQALSEIVARLLEKDPRDRLQSAAETAAALAALEALLTRSGAASGREVARPVPGGSTLVTADERPPQLGPRGDGRLSGSSGRRKSAERRTVTVVCCSLLGTAEASGEKSGVGLEALSEAMVAFEGLAREVCDELEGHLGSVLGHLLWLYFGYPQAHEDDAQRAVRAVQELRARIEQHRPFFPAGLKLRVAIHSGPAVVLTRPGEQDLLQFSDTLDVAMGIQSLTPAGGVVVSAAVQRLLARSFITRALPDIRLPGAEAPTRVFEVTEPVGPQQRESGPFSHLVGREKELGFLVDRFGQVRSGAGQAVMIAGDAGIGKSRLLQGLRERLAPENPVWLVGYGSAYTQNTPLACIVELLERTVFDASDSSPEQKLARLEEFLGRHGLPLAENVPLFGRLLAVATEGRYPPLLLSPEAQRRNTLAALLALLAAIAERHPVVFVVEDLHWVDPSTLELLDLLLHEVPHLPLLLVATFRPEFTAPWSLRAHLTQLGLSPLTGEEAARLVDGVAAGREIPDEVRRQILARTDGIPLFLEELTKAVLEAESSGAQLDVPSTLSGSLMARLDRLGSAKEAAQLASVIGRTFFIELLAAVSEIDEASLQQGLDELLAAEIVYRRGLPPRARYIFKHALIQDAAYLSLLANQRQQVHQKIARVLKEQFPKVAETEPEVLAHHCERAGLVAEAAGHLLAAGALALQRSAYREAVSHCRRGIEMLARLPESRERLQQELALRSTYGVALLPISGFAAEEVERNADRCRILCGELEDTPRLVPSLYVLWTYHVLRGNRQPVQELADEIARLASGSVQTYIGCSARLHATFYGGRFDDTLALTEQAMALHPPNLLPEFTQNFGDESSILPYVYNFWTLWILGRPDAAVRSRDHLMAAVEAIPSPHMLAMALLFEMILWHELRDVEKVYQVAERLNLLAGEQQFPLFQALGKCGSGWVWLHRGDAVRALQECREGLDFHQLIGARLPRSYWSSYLLEAQLAAGRLEEGLALIDEGLTASQTQLDVFFDAELHRLRGEFLLKAGDSAEAEAAFRQGLEIARAQGGRAFELRAAASLARLLRQQGRGGEALPLLAGVYQAYTEGLSTRDLVEARQLLDELGWRSTVRSSDESATSSRTTPSSPRTKSAPKSPAGV